MDNYTDHCKNGKKCRSCGNANCILADIEEPKIGEECGVIGMYDLDGNDVASSIYYGLFALQHRGQESCGIAVSRTDGPQRNSSTCKGMGLVNEVFDSEKISKLQGDIGVGSCTLFHCGSKCCRKYTAIGIKLYQGLSFTCT